jgi:hypothetical protein
VRLPPVPIGVERLTSRTREVSFEPDRCRIALRDAMSKIDIPELRCQRTALSGFERVLSGRGSKLSLLRPLGQPEDDLN